MEGTAATRLRLAVVIFVSFLLQVTVFSHVHPLGIAPELPLLVAIHAGREGGPERGAHAAFCVGLLYDLELGTPLGLWALTCCVVAFTMGGITENLHRPSGVLATISTGIASVAGVLFFAVSAALVGQDGVLDARTLRVALLVGVVNFAISPLANRALRWAYRPTAAYRAAV
ncbi:MAG TPA: rod shape-determining protein MreD [Acidimicrobiales bacterium]